MYYFRYILGVRNVNVYEKIRASGLSAGFQGCLRRHDAEAQEKPERREIISQCSGSYSRFLYSSYTLPMRFRIRKASSGSLVVRLSTPFSIIFSMSAGVSTVHTERPICSVLQSPRSSSVQTL